LRAKLPPNSPPAREGRLLVVETAARLSLFLGHLRPPWPAGAVGLGRAASPGVV